MKKEQIIQKIDHAWNEFRASYASLPAESLLQPGASGEWSVKDIIAHVTAWEGEALKYLPLILEGRRTPRYSVLYGGIDAFNALVVDTSRTISLDKVLRQAVETHTGLIAYLEAAPEEQFASETRFRRRIRLDTYSHYPVHTQGIREWRVKATG
jgi:hypothetical protein